MSAVVDPTAGNSALEPIRPSSVINPNPRHRSSIGDHPVIKRDPSRIVIIHRDAWTVMDALAQLAPSEADVEHATQLHELPSSLPDMKPLERGDFLIVDYPIRFVKGDPKQMGPLTKFVFQVRVVFGTDCEIIACTHGEAPSANMLATAGILAGCPEHDLSQLVMSIRSWRQTAR